MRYLMTMLLAVALAGTAGVAAAQAQPFEHEISLVGAWDDVDEPEQAEQFTLNLRYGYFVSPRLVATASLARSSFEGGGVDTAATTFLVGAKYYFNELGPQRIVPFVDAGIGFTNIDTGRDDGTDLSWEVGGGVAFFFSQHTSIDAAVRLYNTDTDARTQGLRAFFGLTTRF